MIDRNDTKKLDHPLSLLRLPRVRTYTGLSRSEIYRRVSAGTFPKPVKLGERASAWPSHEITAWIESRIAARDDAGGNMSGAAQ
jgi:prophage regulatory protein